MEYDEELDYKIVGSTEANSLKGKISNESPVGIALLGAKVGEVVTVETQAGDLNYKVLTNYSRYAVKSLQICRKMAKTLL